MVLRLTLILFVCAALTFANVSSAEPSSAQQTSKIVARFVSFGASASKPVGYGNVRINIRDWSYEKKTNSKGWLVLRVPCNTEGRIVFGDQYEHSQDVSVPCSRKPVGIGAFDWRDGQYVSDDMENIDGCYLCE